MRYLLEVEYEGTIFFGFQRLRPRTQDLLPGRNPQLWPPRTTVQEEIEVKLGLLLRRPVQVWGAGRTDRGVHATQQAVTVDFEPGEPVDDCLKRLNFILHPAVRVQEWQPVAEGFHARFSARRRVYQYFIWPGSPVSRPFFRNMCWLYPDALELDLMRDAARPLLGTHDFSAYTRKPEKGEGAVRSLLGLEILDQVVNTPLSWGPWKQLECLVCIQVEANAFLRRMVRQLVGNLVMVGSGQWPVTRPAEILASRDALLSAPPAPPHGLFLVRVEYPDLGTKKEEPT